MKRTVCCILILLLVINNLLFPFADEEEWICPNCGAIATMLFCSECGEPKPSDEWVCYNCGETVTGNFCNICGSPRYKEDEGEDENDSSEMADVTGDYEASAYEDNTAEEQFQEEGEEGPEYTTDFTEGYVYYPQNGPLLVSREVNSTAFVIYQYIVDTGERYEVFSYNGDGHYLPTIDFDCIYLPSYQLQQIFSSDMSKMAVSWRDDSDGSDRVGWIDKDGYLTDISEEIHPSTSDFTSVTSSDMFPFFTPDDEFFFYDENTDQYCYVDVDTHELVDTGDIISTTNAYGIRNDYHAILFLPDGNMTEIMDRRFDLTSSDYRSVECSGNTYYITRTNYVWPALKAYDFIDDNVIVGISNVDATSGYCIGKYGEGVSQPNTEYGYDLYDNDTFLQLTPDTDYQIYGCAYGYGNIAFIGARGDDRSLFVVPDGNSQQEVVRISEVSRNESILFW